MVSYGPEMVKVIFSLSLGILIKPKLDSCTFTNEYSGTLLFRLDIIM